MSTAMATEDTGLTIAAAAERLRIHPRTLRRYIREGRLTVTRYTSQIVRVPTAEVDRFLADNICIPTGTGIAYVARPTEEKPTPAPKAKAHLGRFGR
jgi:excisionase family DNA binding protein